NALEYCPRRFYYECAITEFLYNIQIVEGNLRHERSDSGRATTEGDITTLRRVWVWSDRLKLSGFVDVVEESEGKLLPIEYKKGKMGEWLNDHIQLCAQALCLEEMLTCTIQHGYIFYFGSAHREEVIFTQELRRHTEETQNRSSTYQSNASRRLGRYHLNHPGCPHPIGSGYRDLLPIHAWSLPREALSASRQKRPLAP